MNASDTLADAPRRLATRIRRATGSIPTVRPDIAHREAVRRRLADYSTRIGLTDLVREHGSPLLVLDTDRVTTQLLALRRELPRVRIHVAASALPHPAVVRAVDAFGASFAVASRGEIDLLEHEGVAIAPCLHTNPVKTAADLTGAYLRGIRTFVVDSASEIAKFAGLPRDVAVLIRLAVAGPPTRSDPSAAKFGVSPEEARALAAQCRRAGLPIAGLSFHLGSQATSPTAWQRAIRRAIAVTAGLEREHGARFEMLDLGGGLPVAYDEPVPDVVELARAIAPAIAEVPPHLQVIMEPGRFVAAPAMTLVARVIGSATRADGRWHYLDEGVAGAYASLRAAQVRPHVFAFSELCPGLGHDRPASTSATLAGPTCDDADVIVHGVPLPPLDDGDLVVSPMMGAYTATGSSTLSGAPTTPIVVVPR